jgi:hypothetical protein
MDPVNSKALKGKFKDRADKDIDNDGDVDSSDEYLHKRRKAISKAIGKIKEAAETLDEVSTEKLRDYASAALQDKNKAKADKRWKYAGKAMQTVADREVKAAHDRKYNKMEEVELDEAEKPTYHYYVTHNKGNKNSDWTVTHSKKKPFATARDAADHIMRSGGRQGGTVHTVNSKTGNIVQARSYDSGQAGYPRDPGIGDPRHIRDLKEETELDEAEMSLYDKIKAARANPSPDKPVRGRGSKNRNPKTYDRHTALDKEDDRIQATIKKRLKKEEKE